MGDQLSRDDIRDLLNRMKFESELLVSRTASILTLNGFMAASVAVGADLPWLVKSCMAFVMTVINLVWLFRAGRARAFIEELDTTMHSSCEITADETIHKKWTEKRCCAWFSTTTFFSIMIPIGLLLCWVVGIVLVWFSVQLQ